jgi:hypothetical protein
VQQVLGEAIDPEAVCAETRGSADSTSSPSSSIRKPTGVLNDIVAIRRGTFRTRYWTPFIPIHRAGGLPRMDRRHGVQRRLRFLPGLAVSPSPEAGMERVKLS